MKKFEAYSYGCLMAVLPDEVAKKVMGFANLIPDEDIFDDEDGEKGREDTPHITIKYGIHTSDAKEIRDLLDGQMVQRATLGPVTCFHNDEYVVLKIDVNSEDLHALNALVSDGLECTDSFPEYHPHVTIAYLRHREDDPYWYEKYFCDVFNGDECVFEKLRFTTPAEKEYWIDLEPAKAVAARVAISFRRAIDAI